MWSGWREKDYQSQLNMDMWKEREAEGSRDEQCQGRPEGEKHRLDQDWRGDQKQRGLEESCRSGILVKLFKMEVEAGLMKPFYGASRSWMDEKSYCHWKRDV